MRFDERIDGEYRIYVGALDAPRGDGHVAAVVINMARGLGSSGREVFRDESLACGHRWSTSEEALLFALCKAREWIAADRQRAAKAVAVDRSPMRVVVE
jgi:hypothetical protein